jgi:two-component system response regulator RegX3
MPGQGKTLAKSHPVRAPGSGTVYGMRVLVVEDDDRIADPLVKGLAREGFDVDRVATGHEALASPTPDVVLLDLGLPDLDGNEVCRRLRSVSSVPIIVVTARGEEVDRVIGLELGADDYVVKPFGLRELVARIRAVTRRATGPAPSRTSDTLTAGSIQLDLRTRHVTVDGDLVTLTRKEFDLLALLMDDAGATRTRREILEEVWDPHWYGPTKTLDVHIASLRRKLGIPDAIETVRGVGFRMRAGA